MVLHWQLAYMQSVCEVVWLRCLLIKTHLTKFLSFKAFRVELLRAFVPLSAAQWGPGRCSRYGRWSGSWGPYIPCWYPGLHSASPPPVCSSCWPHCPAGLERQSYHTAESGGEKGDGCGSGKKSKQTKIKQINSFNSDSESAYNCTASASHFSQITRDWPTFLVLLHFSAFASKLIVLSSLQKQNRDINSFERGRTNY